jgi:thiol:disulfide interchange protein
MRFSEVPIALLFALAITLGCQQSPCPEAVCAVGANAEGTEAATASTPSSAFGGSVDLGRTYGDAVEAGKKQTKPLMVFFTAKWCRFCRAVEEESFHDHQVVELSKQFVCVAVDVDVDPGVCRDFGVNTLPTVLFTSSSGVPMNRMIGENPPSELVQQMHAALRAATARQQIDGTATVR